MQPFAAAVAASIIVKRNAKNHVLLLHLNEKLQKISAGQLRQGCKAENLNQVQLRQKFFRNRKSIV